MKRPNACLRFVTFIGFGSLALMSQNSLIGQEVDQGNKPTAKAQSAPPEIKISVKGKTASVHVDGQLFTKLDCEKYSKPILYPINGPGQIGMTRNWPMKDDVVGEAHDHPHHKSMWISHEISGVDFWAEKDGKVIAELVEHQSKEFKEENAIRATSKWVKNVDGKTLLTDQTIYRFGADETTRWIDCTVSFIASHGDIEFDDTKEGLFAIRTHPDLRLQAKPKHGVTKVFGKAINSEGVTGKAVWGKPAKWMLYHGPIDGTPMSVAMYDHPSNLRHPTTWHAREYGLVTANPFGLHHFLGKEKGSGVHKLKKGETLTLRYRVEFIKGEASPAAIKERFEMFATADYSSLSTK